MRWTHRHLKAARGPGRYRAYVDRRRPVALHPLGAADRWTAVRLADLEFRRAWLAVAALVVQVLIISILPGGARGLSEEVHLASYLLLGAFLVVNRHIPGLLVIAAGGALNFAAIARQRRRHARRSRTPSRPPGSRRTPPSSRTPRRPPAPRSASSGTSSTPRPGCRSTTSSASATWSSWPAPSCSCTAPAARRSGACRGACAQPRPDRMRRFGAALQARGARRFFFAHAQSSIGSGIAIVGLPLLAYERFHTPWALTVVLLCELLPAVALGPRAGRPGRPAAAAHLPRGGRRAAPRPRSARSRSCPRSA